MRTHLLLASGLSLLAACATPPAPPPAAAEIRPETVEPQSTAPQGQLEFRLASGTYRCDLGKRIEITRAGDDTQTVQVGWSGKRYRLVRNPSSSGLPRFEDAGSGLVWIDLPWKGMLLDGRANRPLASDCVAS